MCVFFRPRRKIEINATVVNNKTWFRQVCLISSVCPEASWMCLLSMWVCTCLLRGFGEREFDGSAVWIVSLADAAFILLFVRSNLLIAADVLIKRDRQEGFNHSLLIETGQILVRRSCAWYDSHQTLSSSADAERIRITAARPIMHHLVHKDDFTCLFRAAA